MFAVVARAGRIPAFLVGTAAALIKRGPCHYWPPGALTKRRRTVEAPLLWAALRRDNIPVFLPSSAVEHVTPLKQNEVVAHTPTTGRRPAGAAGRRSPCRGALGARRRRSRCYRKRADCRRSAAAAGSPRTTRAAPPGRSRTGGIAGMPASAISSSRTVCSTPRRSAAGVYSRSVAGAWSPRRRTRPAARGRAGCS